MREAQRVAGFTLVELIIALGLVAVVTIQILGVFSSQQQTHFAQKRVVEVQEDVRLVVDMVLADLRMAGFMVPPLVGLASVDGGTTSADIMCASDPAVMAAASIDDATSRFPGASLSTALGSLAASVEVTAANQDIDGDGGGDFVVGQGLIVSDGPDSHCARVTSVSSTAVGFTPKTPSGFSAGTADGRAVPAVVYEVTSDGIERNAQLLASGVEDVQVEFGVDVNDDGQIAGSEFPVHDLNGVDSAQVRTVRLSVITRTSLEDPALSGAGLQAAGNRVASGTPDAFRRRRVTVTTAPRNLL